MPATSTQQRLITPRFFGMWTFTFITFFSAFQLLPVIPFRIIALGGSTAAAGWFLSAYTLASAFAAPIMGSLADHFGRRRTLITASLIFIIFSLGYGVIRTLPLLLIAGALHGAVWSSILASSSAIMMTEFIPENRRTQGMAYWGLASQLAVAVAPAVGLLVYRAAGWFALCAEMAGLSVLMAFAGFLLKTRDVTLETPIVVRELWDWSVTRVATSLALTAIGYGGITSYAAILADQRNVHPNSIYFTAFALSVVVVRIFTSHLGDRFGFKVILYPSLVAVPIAFVMLAFAHTRTQFIESAIVFGAGFGSMYPAFAAFIMNATHPSRRARTFGSIVWAFDSGIAIGSIVVGSIGEHYGLTTAFNVAAALSCLALPVFLLTSRRLARPMTLDGTTKVPVVKST